MFEDIIINKMKKSNMRIVYGCKILEFIHMETLGYTSIEYTKKNKKQWVVWLNYSEGEILYKGDDFKKAFDELIKPVEWIKPIKEGCSNA
jgi:hypothetical protein